MGEKSKSASTTIAAPPAVVFAILSDPRQHARIDGSGTVQALVKGPDKLELGSRFGMDMKMGSKYKITNKVVEFEPDRLIAWRHIGTHRWRYDLTPTADGGTAVTETWDLSHCNPLMRAGLSRLFGTRTQAALEGTMVKLKAAAEQDAATTHRLRDPAMSQPPRALSRPGDHQPVPRRVRARLDGAYVVDTTRATYVWEHQWYPQFYVPTADLAPGLLDDPRLAGRVHTHDAVTDAVKIEWDALDAWFEEDEEVFVHPRSPYVRVDALRSTRHVKVELDGVLLAESSAPVLVFETGLPTRYYLDRTSIDLSHLEPSDTETPCPYKGRTSQYWSVRVGDVLHDDLAWCYDFPTHALAPITGLVAFYNEKVDLTVDGEALKRPRTKFS